MHHRPLPPHRCACLASLTALAIALPGCEKPADAPPAEPKAVAEATPAAASDKAAQEPVAAQPAASDEDGAPQADGPGCGGADKQHADPSCGGDHPEPGAAAVKQEEANAGVGAALQLPGKTYGKGVTLTETIAIETLLRDADAWVGKRVRVEGLVTDVCPMRGCWFDMAGKKPGTKLRFKVRDGVMVFPLDAKGQRAVAEGVVRKIPLNLAQSKRYMAHQAEEKGEAFDPATVTEPITLVRLDGSGAVLR
jgi:hypothetical protein